MAPTKTKKKIIVLCDGTWCGRDTGTVTNIAILAKMIGISMEATTTPNAFKDFVPDTEKISPLHPDYPTLIDPNRRIAARYFDGCGHGGNFMDYLWNGATGSDIGKECLLVYQFIVEHFTDEKDCEVWMFGHSRGSYTVRCVAGMINNCGIIKMRDPKIPTERLCETVYRIYRSPWDDDAPQAPRSIKFREKASWKVVDDDGNRRSPIKFMGLIDTVGSLGIPEISAGIGFDYPTFYDQNISSEVEKVYHACSIHDRLWAFEPCRARRADSASKNPLLELHEKWFPGCHYDVGRQTFRFLRNGQNFIEKALFAIPALITTPVEPNPVCADLVLEFLLEAIKVVDVDANVIPTMATELSITQTRLSAPYSALGSGDVYASEYKYLPIGPLGNILHYAGVTTTKVLDFLTPSKKIGTMFKDSSATDSILAYLFMTRDRRIPDEDAIVVPLDTFDERFGASVTARAGLARYASQTYKRWLDYKAAVED